MTNDSSKTTLYHLLDEEQKAGQCRIIEDALKAERSEIEVAETVSHKQLNTTDSGEKKQLYSLVDHKSQEKKLSVNDLVLSMAKQQPTVKQLIPNADVNSVKAPVRIDVFEKKVNFDIVLNRVSYFCEDTTETITRRLLDLTFFVETKQGIMRYDFNQISLGEAASPKIIEKIPGALSFCHCRGELGGYLYTTINALLLHYSGPIFTIYSRPGWKINIRDYITSDGAIAHPEQLVRADGKLHIADRFSGSIFPEYLKMCSTIKEPGKMKAVLSYVLASFIHSVFEDAGFPLKHALFIVGPRGSKKTSVAQCFTQLGEDRRTVKFNFTATESGIQFNLPNYADRVMLIDDLAPSMDYTDKKRKEKMLESILRLCGDSGERVINKAFMKTGAEQIDYRVRGGIVITGEYFYGTGSESSIARAVVVSLEKNSVENALLSHFQRNPEIFEALIFRFLKFVGVNYDKTIYTIRSTMEQIRGNSVKYHFSNPRYVDYIGQYMAIAHIMLGLFAAEGNTFDGNAFLADFHSNINNLLADNDKHMKSQAPIDILLSAIVQEMNNGAVAQWGTPFSEDIRLIRGEDAIFFRQMDLPGIVTRYARKNNLPALPLSSTELGRLLEVHGYCSAVTEGGQKRRGKRYKDYGKERLMCMTIEKITEFEKSHDY